ncbi:hypothetical protein C0Q70_09610 [Pomacea canaliculata]|uniref:G-protein coupled receptors family 1 profile domain-containing protein n=1 Tax=Pomacea canaliculata TaxID=400727 RepID=A0A2T7PAB2_POMCA|nr:hypothetical protein C0Q70_09610 [Pomacea canaliculata]
MFVLSLEPYCRAHRFSRSTRRLHVIFGISQVDLALQSCSLTSPLFTPVAGEAGIIIVEGNGSRVERGSNCFETKVSHAVGPRVAWCRHHRRSLRQTRGFSLVRAQMNSHRLSRQLRSGIHLLRSSRSSCASALLDIQPNQSERVLESEMDVKSPLGDVSTRGVDSLGQTVGTDSASTLSLLLVTTVSSSSGWLDGGGLQDSVPYNGSVYNMPSDEFDADTNVTGPIFMTPTYMLVWVTIANVLVFVTGVIGNTLVILVVTCVHDMKTATNLCLMNLSIADLLVLLICQPSALLEFYAEEKIEKLAVLGADKLSFSCHCSPKKYDSSTYWR